ncbi:PREDICTED: zinc finger protein 853-like [Vollenhovia emeryi]|uniref:zinc finger protein 853-like n=1 Tax=Vollenhovia emeryi TaxID=411798 RepID=UPI0005F366FD|nr:PREDICTED: zinc finger protein 853-like [Vollenhovia emeryi]
MVRACCVPTCHSKKNVPSHVFPKSTNRRKLWLDALHIKSLDLEVEKLRVCHKHFRENNYSCSATRRILKSDAIPSIMLDENIQADSNIPQHIYQNNEEIGDVCQEHTVELELQEQRQLIFQGQNDHNIFVEQQQLKEQQQDLILQQHEEQMQQQQQLLVQQQQKLDQLEETITKHLQHSPKSCRPDLEEISRQNLLTPKAKKFYQRTVQLKTKNRRLKRRLMKQIASKLTINRKTSKRIVANTASVREQFVNMIVRNSNVAPQV